MLPMRTSLFKSLGDKLLDFRRSALRCNEEVWQDGMSSTLSCFTGSCCKKNQSSPASMLKLDEALLLRQLSLLFRKWLLLLWPWRLQLSLWLSLLLCRFILLLSSL